MYFILLSLLVLLIWLFTRKAIYKRFSFKGKIEKFIIVFFVLFGTFCTILYFKYDSKGYEYGLGCSFCNNTMPYNLKPHDGSNFSFTLKDEDDFELVGKGFRYETTNFKIKDFLTYGNNDTSVIVKCTDSLNTVKYLISYETKYKNKRGNQEISFKDLSINDFERVQANYQWVEIDEGNANTISSNKFLFMLGAWVSLLLIIRNLFKLRTNKASNSSSF